LHASRAVEFDLLYIAEPAVFYSLRAWVEDPTGYVADGWVTAERWPSKGTILRLSARRVRANLTFYAASTCLQHRPGAWPTTF
jgi:hypothetical protein